jgi:hypothetical protein
VESVPLCAKHAAEALARHGHLVIDPPATKREALGFQL